MLFYSQYYVGAMCFCVALWDFSREMWLDFLTVDIRNLHLLTVLKSAKKFKISQAKITKYGHFGYFCLINFKILTDFDSKTC
jgi:hypothetical protein